jgi:hypothetical protein
LNSKTFFNTGKLLNKNVDILCVGKGILSLLLSSSLLKRGKSVLILDDDRLHHGGAFSSQFTELELNFFKIFGEYEQLPPLLAIQQYVTTRSYKVVFEDVELYLGNKPHQNLIELARKLPDYFSLPNPAFLHDSNIQNEFNETLTTTLKRLALSAHQFQGGALADVQLFLTHCPRELIDLFSKFERALHPSGKSQHTIKPFEQCFLYFFRSFFHFRLDQKVTSFELFHLFLGLLSPLYQCDNERLSQDLLELLVSRGGQFKKTRVREWKFDQNRPWSVELASFDGIVHPEKISLHGSLLEEIPLHLAVQGDLYRAIDVEWQMTPNDLNIPENLDFYYIRHDRLGTQYPWWKMVCDSGVLKFSVVAQYLKADKLSFQQNTLHQVLRQDLELLFDIPRTSFVQEKLCNTHEVWLSPPHDQSHYPPVTRAFALYDHENPGKKKRLKNVSYFGPLSDDQMGLFSALMNLREAQLYL